MINFPAISPSPWLGDGLAGLLALLAAGWLGYCIKQFRDVPSEWERWIEVYFAAQSTRHGELLEVVFRHTLKAAISEYFDLRPATELTADPHQLREAAAEIAKDVDEGPQRARDLVFLPLLGQFQERLLDALPSVTQRLTVLPPVSEALLTVGCFGGSLEKERRRQRLVRAGYLLSALCAGILIATIVLTRAYDWYPVALLAPALVGGVITGVTEMARERARGRLQVRMTLAEIIGA